MRLSAGTFRTVGFDTVEIPVSGGNCSRLPMENFVAILVVVTVAFLINGSLIIMWL